MPSKGPPRGVRHPARLAVVSTRYTRLDALASQTRSRIRLTGPDAARFLHGTVTADIEGLDPGQATAAGLLTVKGKLVSDMVVLRPSDEGLDLLVPEDLAESVAERLEQHIIMDEVEVEGPQRVALALVWTEDGSIPDAPPGVESYPVRHPAPGRLVVGEAEAIGGALHGVTEADAEAFDEHRVNTASPAWGRELAPDHFPPEVGYVHAVSYDKGCYLGQEPLARIHARGQVNRVMVRVEADRVPTDPGPIELSHETRADAGRWTTIVARDGKAHGLAIVRRSLATPGTVVSTKGTETVSVRIVSAPLGDDPGVSSKRV
jgi:tRNA-modifying protein YgfZ